jgi:predicted ArsR family transcriptional regulator
VERDALNEALGDQLQPTRRRIILALKQRGGMTAAELAEMLGITSMGVRRHLTTLERDRLVRYDLVQRGKGRPSYVYHLSAQAEDLFPKNYASLANELLAYMALRDGEHAVIELLDMRAQRRIRNARARTDGLPLPERVAALADILTTEGYLADYQKLEDGSFLLREHNCAVHDVADEHRHLCRTEISFLQAVLPDAEIAREEHMLAGQAACSYRIRRREPARG